jgi:hypothetical protein
MNDDQVACRPTPVGASVYSMLQGFEYTYDLCTQTTCKPSVGLHVMTCMLIQLLSFIHWPSLTLCATAKAAQPILHIFQVNSRPEANQIQKGADCEQTLDA